MKKKQERTLKERRAEMGDIFLEAKVDNSLFFMKVYKTNIELKPEWREELGIHLKNAQDHWRKFNTDCVGDYPTQAQYDVYKATKNEIDAFVFISTLFKNIDRFNKNKLAEDMNFVLSDNDKEKLNHRSNRPDGYGAAFTDYKIELLTILAKEMKNSPKKHWNEQLEKNIQRASVIWDTFSGDIRNSGCLNDSQYEVYLKAHNEIKAANFMQNLLYKVQRNMARANG